MTAVLADIRPDSLDLPLFIHVLGAMVLVGAVATAVVAALTAELSGDPARMRRVTFWTLLLVAVPAWFVMAAGAQWLYSKGYDDLEDEPTWIGIGFITRELGGLLLLIALACSGVAMWKSKSGLGKAAGIVGALALIGWIVAVWAMGAKPT